MKEVVLEVWDRPETNLMTVADCAVKSRQAELAS